MLLVIIFGIGLISVPLSFNTTSQSDSTELLTNNEFLFGNYNKTSCNCDDIIPVLQDNAMDLEELQPWLFVVEKLLKIKQGFQNVPCICQSQFIYSFSP